MRAISKIIGFVPYGHDDSLILAALVRDVIKVLGPYAWPLNSHSLSRLIFSAKSVSVDLLTTFLYNANASFAPKVTSNGLGLDIWFVEEDNIRIFLIVREHDIPASTALMNPADLRFRTLIRYVARSRKAINFSLFPSDIPRPTIPHHCSMDHHLHSCHVPPISCTHPRSTTAPRSVLEWMEGQKSTRCYLEWKSHRDNSRCMECCFGHLDDDSSNDSTAQNRNQAKEEDWGYRYVRSGPIVSCQVSVQYHSSWPLWYSLTIVSSVRIPSLIVFSTSRNITGKKLILQCAEIY